MPTEANSAANAEGAEKQPLIARDCCNVIDEKAEKEVSCCPALFKAEKAGVNVSNGVSAWVGLNPLVWLLWLLDFLVWLIYFLIIGWVIALYNQCTKRAAGKKTADGYWRQNYVTDEDWKAPELCTKPAGTTAKTAWDCFDSSFTKFPTNPCMGTRRFLGSHIVDPNAKPSAANPARKIYGETDWKSYKEVKDRALAFGSGLRALGMIPSKARGKEQFEATDEPDTLLIWENTCADWMTGLAGAFSQSMVVATSYSTLGADGMLGSIDECACKVLVCNRTQVASCIEALNKHENAAKIKEHLTTIIYTDLDVSDNATVEGTKYQATGKFWKDNELKIATDFNLEKKTMPKLELAEKPEGIEILSFEDVVKKGQEMPVDPSPPEPDTMAVVMYTSGSTGKPKGVCIAHRNLCASIGSMHANFSNWGKEGEEVYVAYLPAAHILELVAEIAMLSFGSQIGYADPRSISSKGACRAFKGSSKTEINFEAALVNAPGAVQEFKPTCLAAVPKIWEIFKQTVEGTVEKGSGVSRVIFEAAFAAVKNAATWRYCPLLNLLFTKKIGAVVGGRMKAGISGGGAISPEVQNFCRIAFGFPLIQGYALTETCCGGCVQLPNDSEDGIVGACMASVEIKLESSPDFMDRSGKSYMNEDTEHPLEKISEGTATTPAVWKTMACAGRGEVWIRGPSVSLGYYAKGADAEKMTKKTEEEFSDNGVKYPNAGAEPKLSDFSWFKTGDIALMTPDGRLKIVDRKKNLVKLKGGEYISYEAMEKAYGNCEFVNALNGGVMCWGSGDVDKAVALIQVKTDELANRAIEAGIIQKTPETAEEKDALCEDPAVVDMVKKSLRTAGKNGKLAPNEGLGNIALISGSGPGADPGTAVAGTRHSPWTPDNGYLTASNKTDRNAIVHGKDVAPGMTSFAHESTIMEITGLTQV